MRIQQIQFRNFSSYGNQLQSVDFESENDFYLLVGGNGNGKCLDPNTEIEININDLELMDKFNKFINNS